MKNTIKVSVLASFLCAPFAFAQPPIAPIAEQQLKLMQSGFEYIEPSAAEQKAGIIALYHKGKSEQGMEGGFARVQQSKNKSQQLKALWTNGTVYVPTVSARVGTVVRLDNYVTVHMKNDTGMDLCVKYDLGIASINGIGHQESVVGCMQPYANYDAEWDVYALGQYNMPGQYPVSGVLDIYDYTTVHRQANSYVYIN